MGYVFGMGVGRGGRMLPAWEVAGRCLFARRVVGGVDALLAVRIR